MQCLNPLCNYAKTQVINSRKTQQGKNVLRRRRCPKCKKRYTSIEIFFYFDFSNAQNRANIAQLLTSF